MNSFLHLLAKDLIQKYGHNFDNLTILFPNKRAGLFLAQELAQLIDRPVWMPEILTLSEFIERQTGLKKAEELTLIIKLYKTYQEYAGTTERFDDFYFWGNMLLGDFDDIDKYLVDAKDLFSNITALREIESAFPYLTPEQVEFIQSFWRSFNSEKYGINSTRPIPVLRQNYSMKTCATKVWGNVYSANNSPNITRIVN